jgi:glycosyltransferase involved in cell wall biosynthesis
LINRALDSGGTERQIAALARSLDRARFEPHVGCFHPDGIRSAELRAAGVPIVQFPVRSFRHPSTIAAAVRMRDYIAAHRIRLVHTFDLPANLFGVPVARLCGVPVVLSSQRAHRTLAPGVSRHLLRLTDTMVDGIVVNSRAVEQEMINVEKVPPRLLHLCHNGIDADDFAPPARDVHAAGLTIGTLAVLRREKGLDTLLEAFARIRAPGMRLVLVGDGPLDNELRRLAARLNLADACRFEPPAARVTGWLAAFDIFVLPSLNEALSNSLMEAMACGCAVIASNTGGNPELVSDQKTGLLFPPGDAAALADRLRVLASDPALRMSLGAAATRFIRDNFSLSSAARRMEEIYTSHLAAV